MKEENALIIRGSSRRYDLKLINKFGGIPIRGKPRLAFPGGKVLVLFEKNKIGISYIAKSFDGPKKLMPLGGRSQIPCCYIVRADKRTLRTHNDGKSISISGWYSPGQYGYYDLKNMKRIFSTNDFGSRNDYMDGNVTKGKIQHNIVFHKHTGGIPGISKNHPEAILVNQYVKWLGDEIKVGHYHLLKEHLYIDLFDCTHWQLIEAKSKCSRNTIRMAIGQLYDYKRYYEKRHPSLAVLLPKRPTKGCIHYMNDNRVNVIWRMSTGKFNEIKWYSQ